ncbi:MAG: FtsH protease activity modulator HflK [Vicinamibacteria bacterium]|nr:FtsH protease activity modulator HflK [Vicinamibacteria bacterium]
MPSVKSPSPRVLRILAGAIIVLLLLLTSYFQIEPDAVGVVQRFGKYVRTTNPGPHFKIPFGVERVTKVPVQRQLKQEFGFRTEHIGRGTRYAQAADETTAESMMLTGDLNVAEVEWIVQYRIRDPQAYLFRVRNQIETFRYMSEAAVRVVVGDHSVDEVITIGREEVARKAQQELQRLCILYDIGIEIQQLVLQNVNPPDPVKPAFNEVNEAIQERERAINEAMAEYNKAVPRAKGEAEQAVRAAEGYATERVNNAQGDAKRFEALHAEYRKAPNVTRKRIYLETMASIIPKMGRKLILDEKARGVLPILQLDGQAKEVSQ